MQNRVQHIVDALAEERWRFLKLRAKVAERSGVAVPYSYEVIVTGKDRHFAIDDPVADQLGGLGDDV